MRLPVGAFYAGAITYSTRFADAFSFTGNTAALTKPKKFSAGLFSERRFLLAELATYSLAAVLPTASGNFGLRGDYSGNPAYNETGAGFAYAKKLGSRVDAGVQFNYSSLKAAGYGAAGAVTFDAGVLFHITDAVQTGLHVYNPTSVKVGKSGGEKLPSIYTAGLGYDLSPQVFVGAEVQKAEDQPLSVTTALHYQFAQKLVARAGISSATAAYYFGFGVNLKPVWLHVTVSVHPYLGLTPGILFTYAPKE